MRPFLTDECGNPSSRHAAGAKASSALEDARRRTAALIGAHPDEIVFTAGATEGNNAAVRSALAVTGRRRIVISRVEHPSILELCELLEREGAEVVTLKVDRLGRLDMDGLRAAVTPETAIVALLHANNETGVLFPIAEIGAICAERRVLFHVDAAQSVGKVPVDLSKTRVDTLAFSGHKFHAPKGVGGLYVRRGTQFRPLLVGGHQEAGRRAGTEPVPGAVALGAAADLAMRAMSETAARMEALRDKLEQGLLAAVPGAEVNGASAESSDSELRTQHSALGTCSSPRLPNVSNISFPGVDGAELALLLDSAGICVSTGSACSSGSNKASHVLLAMGLDPARARGAVRFSLSRYTTPEDVDAALRAVPECAGRLRRR
jgi:cysteine desulfurase